MSIYNRKGTLDLWPKISNSSIKEQGLAKYDGVRAYYAGCLRPELSLASKNSSGSGLEAGKRVYYFIALYKDASGRVVFSDYSTFETTAVLNDTYTFKFIRPNSSYGTLGCGLGATAYAKQAYTNATTIKVTTPHGFQPKDTLMWLNGIGYSGVCLNNTEVKQAVVISVSGEDVTLNTPATLSQWQPLVANQSLLILRTKVGGTQPYLIKEIPRFEDVFVSEHISGFPIIEDQTFTDSWADANTNLVETFTLPAIGREGSRPIMGVHANVHNGRLVILKDNNLNWSNPEAGLESLEQMPRTNSILVGGASSGPLVASVSVQVDDLLVFRKNGISKISGDFDIGIPKEATLTEGDFGCSNPSALARVGGAVVAHGGGKVYSILDGVIYPELGVKILDRLRGVSPSWKAFFLTDSSDGQLKTYFRTNILNNLLKYKNEAFVLDSKNYTGARTAQDTIALSREVLESPWFSWSWKWGFPTHGAAMYKDKEYYISINVGTSSVDPTDRVKQALYSKTNGIYVQFDETDPLKYCDNGFSIENSLTLTPISPGGDDVLKEWGALKLYRYYSNSEKNRISDWSGVVNLFYDLSNNYKIWELLVSDPSSYEALYGKKASGNIVFSSKSTQEVFPLQGNLSGVLEVNIVSDKIYESLSLSSIVIDFNASFEEDSLEKRSDA